MADHHTNTHDQPFRNIATPEDLTPEDAVAHVPNVTFSSGVPHDDVADMDDSIVKTSVNPEETPLDMEPEGTQAARNNMYVAARGHVQRVIDVALLISNMSRLATILQRRQTYDSLQVNMLVVALVFSMITQIVAGVCFFIAHQREINDEDRRRIVDYVAYACVGTVMVLNIFISTFDASWSTGFITANYGATGGFSIMNNNLTNI